MLLAVGAWGRHSQIFPAVLEGEHIPSCTGEEEQQLQGCAQPDFLVGTRQGCPGASPAQETFPQWNLAPELPIHFNYKNQHPECPTQLFAVERWN